MSGARDDWPGFVEWFRYLRQDDTIVVTIGLAILIGMLLGPFGFYFARLPYRK